MDDAGLPGILRRHAGPASDFLGLGARHTRFGEARYRVLPVPYESTTSYGGGTRGGPDAILEASRQIELYDAELDSEPWIAGVCTLPAVGSHNQGPKAMAEVLEQIARSLREPGRVVIALGGEHSITPPLARPYMEDPEVWTLCVDAHADLRASYQGTSFSHACAMRPLAETGRTVQVGVRSVSAEEMAWARGRDLTILYDWELDDGGEWLDRVFETLGPKVYLSLDVDGLDPGIMPATGTPEPGGLSWRQLASLLDRLGAQREVVAADIVELAPIPGVHAPSFLAARAVYRLMGAIESGRKEG
ncbi:MAG: agmatinase [bacterium]